MGKRALRKAKAETFAKGFKGFITRGNVVDLAVGVVIGGAFGKIITSLVNDLIMPPIALLLGDVKFSELRWIIRATPIYNADGVTQATDPNTGALMFNYITMNYGNFIQVILEFIIIAFAIYTVLTLLIRRRQFEERVAAQQAADQAAAEDVAAEAEAAKEAVADEQIALLTEIRDLLKK